MWSYLRKQQVERKAEFCSFLISSESFPEMLFPYASIIKLLKKPQLGAYDFASSGKIDLDFAVFSEPAE